MYVVSFIDADGKLVQVSTPSATVASTLQGYLPTCRVFRSNRLVSPQALYTEAVAAECKRRLNAYMRSDRQHVHSATA
jgi:hypothetical protein